MAASANPTANNQEGSSNQKVTTPPPPANGASVNPNSGEGNTSAAIVSAYTPPALRHNPGISVNWTPDEQSILDDLLAKYASDSTIVRYAKIATKLKDKTVRDVAFRCRKTKMANEGKRIIIQQGKTKTEGLLEFLKAQIDKDIVSQEKGTDSLAKSTSHLTTRANGPSCAPPMIPMDNNDGISYKAIGGVTGDLLDQNAQMFNQISANFAAFQIYDSIDLLCKGRDNILTIMNDLNDLPEVTKQMPPLPVKLNEELANNILPQSSRQQIK